MRNTLGDRAMAQPYFDLDLLSHPSRLHQGLLLGAAEELAAGARLQVRCSERPELMLSALNNHLRGTLRWTITPGADGSYSVTLQRTEDVSPQGVIDLLLRHHQKLDVLLARGLRQLPADAARARALVTEFARELRSHICAENDLLVPRFAVSADADAAEATAIMLREHDEILQQLGLVEEFLGADDADAMDASPFLAILSGTLAKHEHREENTLFPHWHRALEAAPADLRQALFAEIAARLAGAAGA